MRSDEADSDNRTWVHSQSHSYRLLSPILINSNFLNRIQTIEICLNRAELSVIFSAMKKRQTDLVNAELNVLFDAETMNVNWPITSDTFGI